MKQLASIALIALLVMACAPTPGPEPVVTGTYVPVKAFDPDTRIAPRHFTSEEEFAGFVAAQGGNSYYGGGLRRDMMLATAESAMDSAGAPAPTVSKGGFSETNNQVAGVDEADLIKTDGDYIYTFTGNTLYIVSAGEDAKVLWQATLDMYPSGLFIDDDRLLVFGNFYNETYFKEMDIKPRSGMTRVLLYDISDREDPSVIESYAFEGNYWEARLIDGDAYLLTTTGVGDGPHPMPYLVKGAEVRSMPVTDIAYFPIPYDNVQLAVVHSIDMRSTDITSSEAVTIEWGNAVYMNDEHIFIVSQENINEWELRQEITQDLLMTKLSADEQTLIDRIKSVDDDILSRGEKESKIMQVYYDHIALLSQDEQEDLNDQVELETKQRLSEYESRVYSIVTRMDVENGEVTLAATGKVPGSLVNQFSMDEQDNVLRMAVTIEPFWWNEPIPVEADGGIGSSEAIAKDAIMPPRPFVSQTTNAVYTLDSDLNVIGTLDNLAKGERIFSARFMGDRLYMVTFRQVDPFFVIDLSDARNPKVLGDLKIPGFSRYLHPYDETHIIGIGRDATETGRQEGLKISIFDVTDVENPKETAKFVTKDDYAQSSAEWEHKAFLFDREKELLVIPAYSYSWDSYKTSAKYNGAMVFRITTEEVKMRGIIDHGTTNQYWSPMVERSLWIGEDLYTKSPNLIRVNALSDLSSIANVTLTQENSGEYVVY
jgi:uncharacterized secreted protein with C-terminal beta-propeller domain